VARAGQAAVPNVRREAKAASGHIARDKVKTRHDMTSAAPEQTDTAFGSAPHAVGAGKTPYLIAIAGPQVGQLYKLTQRRMLVGRAETADIRLADDGVSREHAELLVDGDKVTVRDLQSTNGTTCNGALVDTRDVGDGDTIGIGATAMVKFTFQDGIEATYHHHLYHAAARDTATSALRRESFLERLEGEVAFALRHATPLAVVMWDLDRLTDVNDRYGHATGDKVLVTTARAVSGTIRREDIFARFGGEEFAVACRATNMARAFRMAERLRAFIAGTSVAVGTDTVRISASFGVAVCPDRGVSSASDLIEAADAAMTRAKTHGRNRTEIAAGV
jgi:diguanylate cyclase (GGDEF)-like protein